MLVYIHCSEESTILEFRKWTEKLKKNTSLIVVISDVC